MYIAFLQGQVASLTVYHVCTSLYTMCLSVIVLEKPGGATYSIPHIMVYTILGPYFTRLLLASFLPIAAVASYVPASAIDACYHGIVRVSPWHWPAVDIRRYIELRGSQLATLAPGPPRGLGGLRANTKSGAPQNRLCEGGLGACPQEILRFYMLWSVFFCVSSIKCRAKGRLTSVENTVKPTP